MLDCKPIHLCVSLVPEEVLTPAVEPQKNRTEFPTNVGPLRSPPEQSTPLVGVEPDMHTTDGKEAASREVVEHGDGQSVEHGPVSEAREASRAGQPPDRPASSDDVQPTPWVLDICLVRVSSWLVCCAKSNLIPCSVQQVSVGVSCVSDALLSETGRMGPIVPLHPVLCRGRMFCDALNTQQKRRLIHI